MIETVDGLYLSALEKYPDRPFIRYLTGAGEHRATYLEATSRIAATVRSLHAEGLKAGDRLVCWAEDVVPTFFLGLACAHAGIVFVPLSPSFSLRAVTKLIERVGARVAFTTAELAPSLVSAGVRTLVDPSGPVPDGAKALDHGESLSPKEAAPFLVSVARDHTADDLYFIASTSGTTGEPKLPVRTQRAMMRRGMNFVRSVRLDPSENNRLLLVVAMTHAVGHLVASSAFAVGAELCVPTHLDARSSLEEVRKLDPTHIVATGRVLRAWFRQYEEQRLEGNYFGPSARVIRIGGTTFDVGRAKELIAQNIDVGEIYGATECGVVAITPLGGWKAGHAGKVLPDVDLKISEDGEIILKVADDRVVYYGDEALTREATNEEGYYLTGDAGTLSEDGYVAVQGRKREHFNTYEGTNIYPQRIEEMMEGMPWVRQAVLVGDQRPFFTALLVLKEPVGDTTHPDGYLEPARHAEVYARAQAAFATMNANLENIERVRRVAIFDAPMPKDLYKEVPMGKSRRVRAGILQAYATRVEALYAPSAEPASVIPDPA